MITAGSLPSGLVLDGATGVLSGTPDATGSSAFTVEVTSGDGQIATAPLTIEVFDELTVTTTALPDGAVGVAYDATVQVGGGAAGGSYAWTVSVGVLPDGLTLEASTGTISGAPTTVGSSTFTLLVTSSLGESTTRELTIDVVDVLTITTVTLPNGVVGVAYLESIQTAGGSGVLAWSVSAGSLPVGLLLGATTGAISGTPSAAATSTFTLEATDEIGQVASMQFMITIDPALVVTTSAVRNGMATVDYGAEVLTATGGNGVYTWALASGSGPLPDGLTLGTDGTIVGTPTTAGTSGFTVEVTSGDGQIASQSLSMVIDPAAYLFFARCRDRLGADTACEVRFSSDTFNIDIAGDTLSMQPDTSIFVVVMPPDSVFRTFFPDVQGPAGFQGELIFDLIGQGGELCGGNAESFVMVTVIPNSGCPGGDIVSSAQEAIHLVQDGGVIEFATGDHPAMRLQVPRSDLTMRPVSAASPVILAGSGDPVLYDGEAFSFLGSGDFVVEGLTFRSPGTGNGGIGIVAGPNGVQRVGAYASFLVDNVTFENLRFGFAVTPSADAGATVTVQNSTFVRNVVKPNPAASRGILVVTNDLASPNVTVSDNTFQSTVTDPMHGIIGAVGGPDFDNTMLVTINGNLFDGCGLCVRIPTGVTNGSIISDNRFINPIGAAVAIDVYAFDVADTIRITGDTIVGAFLGGDATDAANYTFASGIVVRGPDGSRATTFGNTITGAYVAIDHTEGIEVFATDYEIDQVYTPIASDNAPMALLGSSDITNYSVPYVWTSVDPFLDGRLTCNWWGGATGPGGISAVHTPWAIAPIANGGGGACTGG